MTGVLPLKGRRDDRGSSLKGKKNQRGRGREQRETTTRGRRRTTKCLWLFGFQRKALEYLKS
jgi:hypothetical protein